jgi:hypothetical protein
MKHIFKILIIVIFISLISLMVYGTMQQTLRQGINNVPVQLATDAVNKLESGISAKSVPLPANIEISKSLSPFVMIFDQNKKVLVSSATLDGATPVIPQGIFDNVEGSGQDRVTWQPQPGIREAIVVDAYSTRDSNGYVVAGTSLKESEAITDKIGRDIFIGWIILNVFAIVSYSIICSSFFKERN